MSWLLRNKSWRKKPLEASRVKDLAAQYNISLLKAAILLRRGIETPEEILYFLESSPVFLHNPFLLEEMAPAVDRILDAIKSQEKIMIFGDNDADGICSTALLVHFFRSREYNVSFSVPVGQEPYGLTTEKVKQFKQQGITLIICVDNGSSAEEAIVAAYEEGIDVIVLDHHEAHKRPAKTYAFINPHYEEHYPCVGLSASALVLKMIFALDFAQSPHFSHSLCLLYAQKTELGLCVETAIITNMVVKRTLTFHLQENSSDNDRFLQVIQGFPLYTFQAEHQKKLLSDFFNADVYLYDLCNELPAQLERLGKSSLEILHQTSSIRRFYSNMTVLDTLIYLYKLIIIYKTEFFPNYLQSFDLATIGLVADLMPMRNENRIITKIGLKVLHYPQKTSLVALLTNLNIINQNIDTKTIGWRIAPLINASGRMGQADKAVELFIAQDYTTQEKLVQHLNALNEERKNLTEKWIKQITAMAKKSYEDSKYQFVFVYHEDLPLGLTGLLAGHLNKIFSQCLIVVVGKRNDQEISGSLRTNLENVPLEFMQSCATLFTDHGGHNYAGGFSADLKNLKAIQQALNCFFKQRSYQDNSEKPLMFFDAEISSDCFSQEIFDLVEELSPYGTDFPPLVFFTPNIPIQKIQLVGKAEQHVKLTVALGPYSYSALCWNHAHLAEQLHPGDRIDLVYHIEIQAQSAEKSLQILDIRMASSS